MDEEKINDLRELITIIMSYNTPFTLDDLYSKWKSVKRKKDLDSADIMLIKYVLSNMCDNGQVIYQEGAYNSKRRHFVAAAG